MSRARWIAAALLVVFSASALQVIAQTTTPPKPADGANAFPWEGEVTGTNVRVRSGAGTTWYATSKVNTGDRVLVLGERSGWYEIATLPGSFSYVDAADVTRTAGAKTGVIRRDGVSVKAGSHLAASKTSPQAILNKGAVVEIIGEADGFYKIHPPHGAVLYIVKDYVRPVATSLRTGMAERHAAMSKARHDDAPSPVPAPAANDMRTAPQPMGTGAIESPTGAGPGDTGEFGSPNDPVAEDDENMEGAEPTIDGEESGLPADAPIETDPSIQALKRNTTPVDSTKGGAPGSGSMNKASGRYQAMLTMVESDLNATMLLPLEQRDLDSLITRYQEIAAQSDERVPSEYAKIRVGQLQTMADLRKTRAESSTKSSEIDSFKARMTSERMQIMKARMEKVTEKFDFVGELRKSYAFAPEKRRYRLVDPKRQTTIAYVDIPRDINENPEFMIGRTVGIRTSGQRYSMAARIPIAVAASITDLTPPTNTPADPPEDEAVDSADGDTGSQPVHIMPPPLGEPTEKKPATPTDSPSKESAGAGGNAAA